MSKKLTYITHVTLAAKGDTAYIRIVDIISDYGESSSGNIRTQVDAFIKDGIKKATIYVNSRGGSCFEATEMCNEFDRFDEVNLVVGAVAASAATYLVARYSTRAKPSSQFMIHRPRLGTYGDILTIEADTKLLRNMTDDYRQVYAKKLNITEEEVDELWKTGDVWLTANEALKMGLIQGIDEAGTEKITAQDVALLEACAAPVIPTITQDNNIENTMDRNLMIVALGLSADATDEQILEAMKKHKTASDALDAQKITAQANLKTNAETLVDKAIGDKKIDAKMRDYFVGNAVKDLAGTTAYFDGLVPVTKLSAQLTGGTTTDLEARADWSYDKWQEEDPKGLEALATTQPDEFYKLFNSQK